MLTYTLSRREKALLLALAAILIVLAWFVFVFQYTSEQIASLDNEIAVAQANETVAVSKANRMHRMQEAIDGYKAAGVKAKPVPDFDNMTPLMTELNATMASASTYMMSFDDLDTETSSDYILRGVTIDFSCGSFSEAELIVTALARGSYPCSIDSVTIADGSSNVASRVTGVTGSGSASVSASVHVTYFERPSSGATATTATTATAATAANG